MRSGKVVMAVLDFEIGHISLKRGGGGRARAADARGNRSYALVAALKVPAEDGLTEEQLGEIESLVSASILARFVNTMALERITHTGWVSEGYRPVSEVSFEVLDDHFAGSPMPFSLRWQTKNWGVQRRVPQTPRDLLWASRQKKWVIYDMQAPHGDDGDYIK